MMPNISPSAISNKFHLFFQFCSLCRIHPFVVDIVTWLAWSNSSYNPILYSWFNKEYCHMYKRMFGCTNRNRVCPGASITRSDMRNAQTANGIGVVVPTQDVNQINL